MKHIILSVVIATVICSCAVQEPYDIIPECKEVVFTAYSGETNTKTVLQPNGRIYWVPGDEICIYYGSSDGNRFTADIESLAEKATFRGKLDGFTGTTESGSYNYFWALYPYSSAISCDGAGIKATLNPLQEAKANSFANNTNITLAKSSGLALSFFNVCSYFRFTLTREGVKSVSFRGNAEEAVAGTFEVSMGSDGKPTAPIILDGQAEITLMPSETETFEVGTSYYFVLLPQVFESGFTLTFRTIDNYMGSRSVNVQAPFNRNEISWGDDFDRNVVYEKIGLDSFFPDDTFRQYVLDSFDTNHDGDLSDSECDAVTTIIVDTERISSLLGVELFPNLESLTCRSNTGNGHLTSLDVTHNTHLTYLNCLGNQLSDLDVSQNPDLRYLNCYHNQLSALDVSNNHLLEDLRCYYNNLSVLDISRNHALSYLRCNNNPMSCLFLAAGQTVSQLYKNEETSIAYKGALPVAFPDNNFRSYVFTHCDIDNDGYLSENECMAVTSINVNESEIQSLNGLNFFENLKSLSCSSNELLSLDVSNNAALRFLDCSGNSLSSLDLSNNVGLQYLYCSNNQLSSLDVSTNAALLILTCTNNRIEDIDLSQNTSITYLGCGGNQLSTLNVANNDALESLLCYQNELTILNLPSSSTLRILDCFGNQLSGLNLSNKNALQRLRCEENSITTLDLSDCISLEEFNCNSNQLNSLDLSNNSELKVLRCNSNQFRVLDVSYNLSLSTLDCTNNPLLYLYMKTGQEISNMAKPTSTSIILK